LSDTIPVSFVEHKWGQPHFNDIEVKISIDGNIFLGRGTDKDGDLALEKASSEAIERWCCHRLHASTVGCAVHSNELEASKNAQGEFIERLVFDQFIERGGNVTELFNMVNGQAYQKIRLWYINNSLSEKVVIAIAVHDNVPVAIGIGHAVQAQFAAEKAYVEALRNLAAFKHDPELFKKITSDNSDFWCCDPNFISDVLLKLEKSGSLLTIEVPSSETKTFRASQILGISSCPLYFSQAKKKRGED